MKRILHKDAGFAYAFTTHLIKRSQQLQQDLANSLLDSAQERARVLSFLQRWHEAGETWILPSLTQQDLANMVGVSRQRVHSLMKRLRNLRPPLDS